MIFDEFWKVTDNREDIDLTHKIYVCQNKKCHDWIPDLNKGFYNHCSQYWSCNMRPEICKKAIRVVFPYQTKKEYEKRK